MDRLVGGLLHVRLVAFFVVLADRVLLEQALEDVDAVASDVTHGDPGVLGVFVGDLDHFLAPLLVELGDANAKRRTFGGRTEAEVGVADRVRRT